MLIGTYYYPWYTTNWLGQTKRRMDPPVLGHYNNTKCSYTVVQHMKMMRQAGIDFASMSWDPRSVRYEHVLDAAEEEGIKVTVFYESLSRATGKNETVTPDDLPSVLKDMKQLAPDLQEDCWLKIDNKPVVMIYVTRNYVDPDEAFGAIREILGDVYLVGDEIFWKTVDPDRISQFDALTSYNWFQPGRFSGSTDEEICTTFLDSIRDACVDNLKILDKIGKPYWPVAIPGYDDTNVRPQVKHPPIPRLNGDLFRRSLNDARIFEKGTTMICSFNEWFEDTQIEPTKSYGNKYLDILREWKNA